jgi:arylsulfatase A-like enzyme
MRIASRTHSRTLLLVAGLLASLATSCERAPDAPFLLLITVDTLRADHVGAYQASPYEGLTPNIDALAAESLRFTAAFAPASYTLPSMASLHTGLYPEEVGIFANRNMFRGSSITLAELLRLNGWRTGAVVSNYVLRSGTGIEKGFDVYDDAFTHNERNRDQPERMAADTTDAALKAVEQLLDGPASGRFLWVHYQDVHGPYLPPGDRRDRYLEAASLAEDAARELPSIGINAIGAIPKYQLVNDRFDIGYYRAGYAGEVQFVDEQIGRLLGALESKNLLDDATIAFTADHGESLGEDDYFFSHGEFLSDVLVRIPLLIRSPKHAAGVRTDVVSMVDLLPTLATSAEVPLPPNFPGRDLLADGAESAAGRAYLATLMGSSTKRWGWVEDGHVFVRSDIGGRAFEQLRALDSESESESATEDPARKQRMRASLQSFRNMLEIPSAVEQELSGQDREMLRRLGYLE